jgi:hypothetical protein
VFVAPARPGRSLIRADTGFENHKLLKTFDARGVEFSIGVKQRKSIRALIDLIDGEVTVSGWRRSLLPARAPTRRR